MKKAFFVSTLLFLSAEISFGFTLGNFQKGWATNDLKVNLNPTNCPADITARLEDSFKLWNSIPTSALKLSMGNTNSTTTPAILNAGSAPDTPLVTCSTNFGTDSGAPADSVAGVGFTRGLSNSPNILYGGVILNVQPGANANISQSSEIQRSVVIAHELGHMLGLGHSEAEPSLMYYSAGIKSNLSLSKDDWDGMAYLYPRDELGKSQLIAGCGTIKGTGGLDFGADILFILSFFYGVLHLLFRFKFRPYKVLTSVG